VILSRDTIRRHLAVALHLSHDYEAAVDDVARGLGVAPELVREAAQPAEEPEATC
jgi:ribosomal protein S18 acetylase RimI-like enzyme